jgi:hypothetical protein
MSEPDFAVLERELVELGRSLVTEPPRTDLASNVLARIATEAEAGAPSGAPSGATAYGPPTWLRGRRLGWAIAAATVLVLALIPPVRAAVLELLHVGGVVVRQEPAPSGAPRTGSPTASPQPGATAVTLEQAQRAVGFHVGVPASLGAPTSVALARDGKVVELTWRQGNRAIRLDVFDGSLSWGFLKTVWSGVTPTQVKGQQAVWLDSPHLIEWVDRAGSSHREQPRLAGPTLAWVEPGPAGEVTYRLEGPKTLPDALTIAESTR